MLPVLLLALATCVCQQPASGKGVREESEPPVGRKTGHRPLAGGFTEIPLDEEQVSQAYALLTEELRTARPQVVLLSVKKAERQIVAGTNIRFVCSYRVSPGGTTYDLTATVYFDLAGNRSLRSIVYGEEKEP